MPPLRPPFCRELSQLTSEEFEKFVYQLLASLGRSLGDFRVARRDMLIGKSGEYEIDVTARFTAFGNADFLVLVECKHWKRPVGRDVVEVLISRLAEVGGHKGIIFTTSDFQSGAVRLAQAHGIATVILSDGRSTWRTRCPDEPSEPTRWLKAPEIVGCFYSYDEEQKLQFTVVSYQHTQDLDRWLFNEEA